jgi:hypothetical protein
VGRFAVFFFFFLTRGFPANKADDRKGFSPRELEAYSLVADEVPVVTLNMRIPRSRIFHSAITSIPWAISEMSIALKISCRIEALRVSSGASAAFSPGFLTNSRSPSTNYRGFRVRGGHLVVGIFMRNYLATAPDRTNERNASNDNDPRSDALRTGDGADSTACAASRRYYSKVPTGGHGA